MRIILATHSPQIINDRWDLTEELKHNREQLSRAAAPNIRQHCLNDTDASVRSRTDDIFGVGCV